MNYTSYTMPSSKHSKKSASSQQPALSQKGQTAPSSLEHKMDSLQSTITQYLPSQSTPTTSAQPAVPKQGRERANSSASVGSNQKSPGSVGSNQGSRTHQKINDAMMIPSLRDTPPEDWDIDQVGDWLDAMGFPQDRQTFKGE